jgi:hypothetical protein
LQFLLSGNEASIVAANENAAAEYALGEGRLAVRNGGREVM